MTGPPPPPSAGAPTRTGGTVLVLAGGAAAHPSLVLHPVDLVVAADSGARLAPGLGVDVHLLVGDLDSLSERRVAALQDGGAEVVRYPEDKDATDLELALATAVARDPGRIVVVGGDGGRIDHAIANVGALAAVAGPGRRVEAWMGPAHLQVTVDEVVIGARVAETVSLVPLNGPAVGVTTEGLRWPLARATLDAGTTWGMSNEVTTSPARVTLWGGTLAVIRPHALDPGADRHRAADDRPPVAARSEPWFGPSGRPVGSEAVDPSSPLADRRGGTA